MNISSYGASYNYSGYGILLNKAKTPTVSAAIPDEKPDKPKSNNSATSAANIYNPFKDIAETGNVSLPSWIYTKTEPTRSDAEILKDMAELAKKHAEQGTFQNPDDEFQSLTKEYISPVSPDRENILKDTVNEINENIKISHSQKNIRKKESFSPIGKLLQVLEDMEKVGNEVTSNRRNTASASTSNGGGHVLNMNGDNYDACVENGEVKMAFIRDNDGRTVICFDSLNRSELSIEQSWTDAEGMRSGELMEVYNEAYMEASSSKGLISGNSFDAVG